MNSEIPKEKQVMKVSNMAENLIGSEILKLAAEINNKIKQGEKIYNMTVGDFNPKIFPIVPYLLNNNLKRIGYLIKLAVPLVINVNDPLLL